MTVGPGDVTEYCSYTKAIEYLGDRWSLLILRQLGGRAHGFNELVAGLPGRISRSTLTDRLHRLESLGLVARTDGAVGSPYRLTEAGVDLMPTLDLIREWAASWIPDDPSIVEHDPDVLVGWLIHRVDPVGLPERQTTVEVRTRRRHGDHRCWLVLEQDREPYGCLTDPLLDAGRYVYVGAAQQAMVAIGLGRRDWAEAIRDGSVTVDGDPVLAAELATWFRPAGRNAGVRSADPV